MKPLIMLLKAEPEEVVQFKTRREPLARGFLSQHLSGCVVDHTSPSHRFVKIPDNHDCLSWLGLKERAGAVPIIHVLSLSHRQKSCIHRKGWQPPYL